MMNLYEKMSPRVQQYLRILFVLFATGATIAVFALGYYYKVSGKAAWKSDKTERQLSVTGEGTIAIKPDVAVFTATAVTQGATAKEAQMENTRRSDAIMKYLATEGVAEKDIKTIGYYISPQYQYEREVQCFGYPCPPQKPPKIASYEVRHSIEIKVRDLDKADDFLGGVVAQGANEVGSLSFQIDDEEGVKADARKAAIDDAREKAKRLAKDLGVRLGKIVSFSESGGGYPIYARALDVGYGGAAPAKGPEIAPGEQETKVSVTITYEFR